MEKYERQWLLCTENLLLNKCNTQMHPHDFYPDANQTLRLSYGKVEPLPSTGSESWQTTLSDLVKRNNPEIASLTVPQQLLFLYQSKDFGKWSENGIMSVNFLTTAQTTGGNSGSPVLMQKVS